MDATPAPLTAADLARFDALAEEQRRPLPGQVALFDLPRHDAPTEPDARALMVFGGGKRRNARREILAEKVRGVWKARKDHEPIDVWCPACGAMVRERCGGGTVHQERIARATWIRTWNRLDRPALAPLAWPKPLDARAARLLSDARMARSDAECSR